MRKKFVQSLAVCQLELNGLNSRYDYQKPKEVQSADEDEFIDVTGDYPSESESVDRLQVPKVSYLEQPPSKIYYDNIEKESSDGGFFDRDELDDEDERNELVIDCKLSNDSAENKTDKSKSNKPNREPLPPLTEPEIVFNFTLVDTKLVYNEPSVVRKRPYPASNVPTMEPTEKKSLLSVAPLAAYRIHPNRPKEVRIYPQPRVGSVITSGNPRKIIGYHIAKISQPPPVRQSLREALLSTEPIGSKLRPSAFTRLVKSQPVPQSVPLKPTLGPYRPSPHATFEGFSSPAKHCAKPSATGQPDAKVATKYTKHSVAGWLKQSPSELAQQRKIVSLAYPPLQFGFGVSVLQNLHDTQQPLDYSKNSPLVQYETIMKSSSQPQHRYTLLRSLPLPVPPQAPRNAVRPKIVPVDKHPTLCTLHRKDKPPAPPPRNPPPPLQRTPPKPKPDPPAPVTVMVPPPAEKSTIDESFRVHVKQAIDIFCKRRQNEIDNTLRLFNDRSITQAEFFRRLEYFQVRFDRDYLGMAGAMIKRHGYRFRTAAPPIRLDYRWTERPQEFVDYFGMVKGALRPHAPEETLNIYRIVVGGLLEQFRPSMEHFLSTSLTKPH